jgi:germination protein M
VARRKTASNSKGKGSRTIVIFWLVFVIVIICIFMINAPTINKNFNLFKTRMTVSPAEEDLNAEEDPAITVVIEPAPKPAVNVETKPQTPEPAKPSQPEKKPEPEKKPTTPKEKEKEKPTPVQTRDRAIYFANVGSDGQILHSKVTRKIPVSDSPMQDTLNIMLAGPTSEELSRGLLNLIPKNTRILSATVRGNTAYISFSEDFLFNTFGVEGYVAQLRQIVWTVTEFQNVKDVQILVEGRRMDYLGEGIWIGSPISRQSF